MLLWRRVALPAFLGVLGLIWAAAHALAHDVASQPPAAGHGAGHSVLATYLAYLPTSLALCLILATAIATGMVLGRRWTGLSGPPIWLFGVVPVLGFAADTLVELPTHGLATAAAVLQLVPVFLVGLLVQLPFALVAVGLASRILWLVERLAWALGEPRSALRRADPTTFARAQTNYAPVLVLAGSERSRAPPSTLIS